MKQKIARIISNYLLNPGFLLLIILIVAILKSKMPSLTTLCWMLAIVVLNGVIPGLFYLFFTSRGYVFDDTLQNKKVQKERLTIFSIFLTIVTFELLILVSTHAYQPLLAVFAGGILAGILGGAVTYFWKISIHASLTTFFVTMIILLFGLRLWPVVLLIPLVFWSRIVLIRHTFLQLLFGFLLSLVVVWATFNFFGIVALKDWIEL